MIKKILLVNLFLSILIVLVSYITTSDYNQILSNHHLLIGFGGVLSFMTLLWLISLNVKDASIVDIFWGPTFIVLAFTLACSLDNYSDRTMLMILLVTLWGLRLAGHIGFRNIGHGEDLRYIVWRKEAGKHWWWFSFFRVFYMQGSLAIFVGLPLYYGQINPASLTMTEIVICTSIFALGLLWEAISDLQLKSFRKNSENKGKICKVGLWKYSRHPNYFGDLVSWIGLFSFTISSMNVSYIIGSSIGPLMIGLIFYKITGPMMDDMMIKSRADYKEYMKNSNMLLPNLMKGK